MTASEADNEWGLPVGTVKRDCNRRRFNDDEIRKSGKTWLVTRSALERVYGPNKNEKDDDKMKKELIGEEMNLLDIGNGISEYGLEHIFPDNETLDLNPGKYSKVLKGSYSYQDDSCKEDEHINIIFETIGEWEVTPADIGVRSHIDETTVKVRILDVDRI